MSPWFRTGFRSLVWDYLLFISGLEYFPSLVWDAFIWINLYLEVPVHSELIVGFMANDYYFIALLGCEITSHRALGAGGELMTSLSAHWIDNE